MGISVHLLCVNSLGDVRCRANRILIRENESCDKTIRDCLNKYDNVEHFSGFKVPRGELCDFEQSARAKAAYRPRPRQKSLKADA